MSPEDHVDARAREIYDVLNLLSRSLLVWLAILAVAVVNGAFRQGVLVPRLGDAVGHVLSTVLLSCVVFVVAWLTIGWMNPATTRDAWIVGGFWLALTLVFEFLGGHYLFGTSWEVLLADYNILHGRIWPLVLIVTVVAPALAARLRS